MRKMKCPQSKGTSTLPQRWGRGILVGVGLWLLTPQSAYAQATFGELDSVTQTLFNGVFALVGVTSLIGIIIGAYQYISSEGDPKKVDSAKNSITWAVIGGVIGVAAYLVVRAVWSDVLGFGGQLYLNIPH